MVAAHQEAAVPFDRLRLGFGGSDEVEEIVGVIQRVVVHFGVHVEGFQQLLQAIAFLNCKKIKNIDFAHLKRSKRSSRKD